MPCMNSTSAGDRGGKVAFVDDGSVLLGAPGAPGCTTTGFAGSGCWAAAGNRKSAETPAASSARVANPRAAQNSGLGSRRTRTCLVLVVRGDILIGTRLKSCHEHGKFAKREKREGKRERRA